MATSPTSTSSLTSSQPASEAANEDAVREALEAREGVRTLGRMQAVDVMGDSMEREERVIAAEQKALHDELHGKKHVPATSGDEDAPMKIMAARDVKVIYGQPRDETPPQQPQQPAPTKPTGMPIKLALLTSLVAGPALGAAAGVGIPWLVGMFDKEPAAEFVDTDTDTQYELRFGKPPAAE